MAAVTGASAGRSVLLASYASFLLIGWTGLFVPSLLRVLRVDFEQTDASFGLAYLVIALLFAAGALTSGLIAQRIGRRVVLPAAALLVAGGMTLDGLAPSWSVFLIGAALAGAGGGAIDAVVSSVIFTASCALVGGLAILAALAVSPGPIRIGLFLTAGFAFGPVYPMILAVAGSFFPHLAAAVAGVLTAAGVAGSIVYPPLMGLIADAAGLGAGMLGAAALVIASGGAVVVAGRVAVSHRSARWEPGAVGSADPG